jgi:hypothetical protein
MDSSIKPMRNDDEEKMAKQPQTLAHEVAETGHEATDRSEQFLSCLKADKV